MPLLLEETIPDVKGFTTALEFFDNGYIKFVNKYTLFKSPREKAEIIHDQKQKKTIN